jgi:hypothetical protein
LPSQPRIRTPRISGFATISSRTPATRTASCQRLISPFGRFGIGLNSMEGFSDLILDFRGGVDFQLRPDAPYLFSVMVSLKRVLADFEGFNVLRLSAGIVLPLDK